jgi:hypothetical protein
MPGRAVDMQGTHGLWQTIYWVNHEIAITEMSHLPQSKNPKTHFFAFVWLNHV